MEGSAYQPQQQDPEPQASEQWSLCQTLAPLGQKLLQMQVVTESLSSSSSLLQMNTLCDKVNPICLNALSLQPMCELLFLSSFCALTWGDVHTVTKCTNIAGLIFEKVFESGFNHGFSMVCGWIHVAKRAVYSMLLSCFYH